MNKNGGIFVGFVSYMEDNDSIIQGRLSNKSIINRKVAAPVNAVQKSVKKSASKVKMASRQRILPVIILADTSGSMSENGKIGILNNSIRKMLSVLATFENARSKLFLSIISFGGNEPRIHQPFADIKSVAFEELHANGKTPLGAALAMAVSLINDEKFVPLSAHDPTVVLVSDGIPTDTGISKPTYEDYKDWLPIKSLYDESGRASKCHYIAMGIGADADTNMLKAFTNGRENQILKSNEASDIARFFQNLTEYTVSRLEGVNPNDYSLFFSGDSNNDDLPIG